MSNQIDRVHRVAAQHADNPGLQLQRKRLALLHDFPKPGATGGLFRDQFARRPISRSREWLAAGLALERGIFQDGSIIL